MTYYNGAGPFAGSMATDDYGIAMRVRAWHQYKKRYDHYFTWETTNYEAGGYQVRLLSDARTFGFWTSTSSVLGRTGFQYSNGDGVLLYPGQDALFPEESYNVDAAFPSWRLKMMRRGINDFTYLTLATKYNAKRVNEIVQTILPKVNWEYGVQDVNDPTYQYGGVSWSVDPDVWERAREELAQIISNHR